MRLSSNTQCHIKGLGCCSPQARTYGDLQLVGVENFYVLYVAETCKIWAVAAAKRQQKYVKSYLCENSSRITKAVVGCNKDEAVLPGEAKKRQKQLVLAGYRSVKRLTFWHSTQAHISFNAALLIRLIVLKNIVQISD